MTPHHHRRRPGERGLTLIEMLVALSVISIGVVGLAYGFTAVVRSAGIAQTQATLDGAASYLADYLQADTGYHACAATYATPNVHSTVYGSQGVTWAITSVAESSTPAMPGLTLLQTCASGRGRRARATGYDYGIQEITFTVSKEGTSLTQVVWKEATT